MLFGCIRFGHRRAPLARTRQTSMPCGKVACVATHEPNMRTATEQEIHRFLRTGQRDVLSAAWPGVGVVEQSQSASMALRCALISAVRSRTRHATIPDGLKATDLMDHTRRKVEPMVRGLFPLHERTIVLDVLARSVVYLTPVNIERVLYSEVDLGTAWRLANLYLISCDAQPLSAEAPEIIGLSEATTCYVSMQYFRGGSRFDDVVVHEAAHIFHNCKRDRIGLQGTRRREWVLEIDFRMREPFAYACEALSRIYELADGPRLRRALLAEIETGPMPSDDRVDAGEYIDILQEAVSTRNGWKRILQRCAPQPGRSTSRSTAAS